MPFSEMVFERINDYRTVLSLIVQNESATTLKNSGQLNKIANDYFFILAKILNEESIDSEKAEKLFYGS